MISAVVRLTRPVMALALLTGKITPSEPRHQGKHRKPASPLGATLYRTKKALPLVMSITFIVGLAALAVPLAS